MTWRSGCHPLLGDLRPTIAETRHTSCALWTCVVPDIGFPLSQCALASPESLNGLMDLWCMYPAPTGVSFEHPRTRSSKHSFSFSQTPSMPPSSIDLANVRGMCFYCHDGSWPPDQIRDAQKRRTAGRPPQLVHFPRQPGVISGAHTAAMLGEALSTWCGHALCLVFPGYTSHCV